MQSTSVVKARLSGTKSNRGVIKKEARHQLSLYAEPPFEEISLDEFELFALDRLQVLKSIEMLRARGVTGENFNKKLNEVLNKFLRMHSYGAQADDDARKDKISHFILRLAYCRSEDLRRWFLLHEAQLFRFRLEQLSVEDRGKFMKENNMNYETVTSEEKEQLFKYLTQTPAAQMLDFNKTVFYKVPFTEALRLVSTREVYLQNGNAYVPMEKVVSILQARFRAHLSKYMSQASNAFAHVCADTRIAPLVKNLNVQYTGNDYGAKQSGITGVTPDKLDMLAQRSFPLCMQQMHQAVKREHHLKHTGRLQFGLFLKGCGLSLEDALIWWQREFTKGMSVDQFNKKGYPYEIRYKYGKEGKRTNYSPYSCTKLILGEQPQVGQTHGCPYKSFGDPQLSALLNQLRIGGNDKDEILMHKKNGHFQLSCQKHFEVMHKPKDSGVLSMDGVGNHPNAWFEASMSYYGELNGDNKENDRNNANQVPAETSSEEVKS